MKTDFSGSDGTPAGDYRVRGVGGVSALSAPSPILQQCNQLGMGSDQGQQGWRPAASSKQEVLASIGVVGMPSRGDRECSPIFDDLVDRIMELLRLRSHAAELHAPEIHKGTRH